MHRNSGSQGTASELMSICSWGEKGRPSVLKRESASSLCCYTAIIERPWICALVVSDVIVVKDKVVQASRVVDLSNTNEIQCKILPKQEEREKPAIISSWLGCWLVLEVAPSSPPLPASKVNFWELFNILKIVLMARSNILTGYNWLDLVPLEVTVVSIPIQQSRSPRSLSLTIRVLDLARNPSL